LASSLVQGLLRAGYPPQALWGCNRGDPARLRAFAAQGLVCTQDKAAVCAAAPLLLLLVKPKDAPAALQELAPHLRDHHVLVSCMAAVPLDVIERALGGRPRVLRAMPNIASAVGQSATALAVGRFAEPADVQATLALWRHLGGVTLLEESALDAATAVCGSGPAYVFLLMEALAEAALRQGLPPAAVPAMVRQTVLGAAQLAAEGPRTPQDLRAAVSSKGGTTEAATEVLEAAGFRQALAAAVQAAVQRSRTLSLVWQQGGPEAAAASEG